MTPFESHPADGPDFRHEHEARQAGTWPVAGVDEAGRGPWAGPVVAAAVVFDGDIPAGIDDSKKLTPEVRETLCVRIMGCAHVGIGIAGVEQIDRDNILQATLWAMARAIEALPRLPALAIVDGNQLPVLGCGARALVGGDGLSLSVAAASIVAKTTRDRIMAELSLAHPGYGWEHNMGYGTPEHRDAIGRLGITLHHRRSFAPIRAVVEALKSL